MVAARRGLRARPSAATGDAARACGYGRRVIRARSWCFHSEPNDLRQFRAVPARNSTGQRSRALVVFLVGFFAFLRISSLFA
jgi:hypothetical protein